MAVLGNINNNWFFPSKHKVADRSTEYDAQAKPYIVCHED